MKNIILGQGPEVTTAFNNITTSTPTNLSLEMKYSPIRQLQLQNPQNIPLKWYLHQ